MADTNTTLKPILVTLLLFGLFAFAIITSGIMIAEQNDPDQSIGNDPTIAAFRTNINETLDTAREDTQSADELLTNSSVSTTTNIVFIDAVSGLWKTLRQAPTTIWELTGGLMVSTIGIPLTVVALITSLLLIIILIAVIRFVTTGVGG